jgi:uncharacterized membrane protein YkoI
MTTLSRKTRIGIATAIGALALALAGIGTAYAAGVGDSDNDGVTGATADRARAAALQAVPGGRAGEVDRESDEGNAAYGVTVTKPDATKVEVHLNAAFTVLGVQPAGQDRDGDDGDDG